MNHFRRQKGELYCEEVPLSVIADHVGTPAYVYSTATLRRHARAMQAPFEGIPHLVCYSVKACSNLAILKLFQEEGLGFDIVSGGELFRAKKAGAKGRQIVFSGVGKSPLEIAEALKAGILLFNVESEAELIIIDAVAGALKKRAPVSLRINPDVDPKTHAYIATGLRDSKFGIPHERARDAYQLAKSLPNLDVVGLDCHIGSQLTEVAPFLEAVARLRGLIEQLASDGIGIRYLDLGGGLGIKYLDEAPPDPKVYGKALRQALSGLDVTLLLEPGRVLVGNAAVLLTQVLLTKEADTKKFVVVDAAMNDLIRPTLYDAHHEIEPVARPRRRREVVDVVGPICESGDFLAKDRELPELAPGELVAIRSVGAYGFSMSSNYNSRPRACEVLVDGDRFRVIRERESYKDLVRGETP
jgi:diaminopimelate decarboxylase